MKFYIYLVVMLLLAVAFVQPVQALQDHSEHQHSTEPADEQTQYVCPMHSQIVRDEPGTCTICGMDLVKKEPSKGVSSEGAPSPDFTVNQQQQQAIRVTTAQVQRKTLKPQLSAQAQVNWQQSAQYHVHSRAEGWVEELYADIEGQWVEKGEKLYRVYAPDLVVAQDDYLQLLDSLTEVGDQQSQQSFKRRGRQRLQLLGMTEQQIEQLEQSQQAQYEVDYYAPKAGYLTNLNIQQGMYVNPGQELMTISGDQGLWFMLDIPVRYADQVKVGQMAHISSDQVDGHWMNRIDYIYPKMDEQTQTLTARVPVSDSINRLREGLWATAHVELGEIEDALAIPVASLIQTAQNNRVVVQTGEQEFAVREIKIGLRVGDEIEVKSGLSAGEQVVTNGQFLLDSEASLQGLQPNADEQPEMSTHDHGSH
ncbi:MAG: efflux RND transporter periplasmic adaptor subunit [Pseudomonadota bacterium]